MEAGVLGAGHGGRAESEVKVERSNSGCSHEGTKETVMSGNASDLLRDLTYLKNCLGKLKSHPGAPEIPWHHLSGTLNKAWEAPRERKWKI